MFTCCPSCHRHVKPAVPCAFCGAAVSNRSCREVHTIRAIGGLVTSSFLLGCPPPYGPPPSPFSPSPTPFSPRPTPTWLPSALPTSWPSAGAPTVGPSPTPFDEPGPPVALAGWLYYPEGGAFTRPTTVVAVSTSAQAPYRQTVQTSTGAFRFTGVPTGVSIEIVATSSEWRSSARTYLPKPDGTAQDAVVEFPPMFPPPPSPGPQAPSPSPTP